MSKHLVCLLSLLAIALPAAAQNGGVPRPTEEKSDFQARTGFTLEKRITERLTAAWDEELRLKESLTEVDRIYSSVGMYYAPLQWFKAGFVYTYIAINRGSGRRWEQRHRLHADLTGSLRIAPRWKLSLRERVRATFLTDEVDPRCKADPEWTLRSRLMIEHELARRPLAPYFYIELSNTLNAPEAAGNHLDKIRTSVGLKYAPGDRSEFDFYYRFDRNLSLKPAFEGDRLLEIGRQKEFNHILGIFYTYSF